jgi:hypothetical protein
VWEWELCEGDTWTFSHGAVIINDTDVTLYIVSRRRVVDLRGIGPPGCVPVATVETPDVVVDIDTVRSLCDA